MKLEEEIKQRHFLSNSHKASLNLLFTASWLLNRYEEIVKPYGITVQQFNVLRILKGQNEKAISASEIKARMLDKNSDISRILDRLELKDLVTKQQNKHDRRTTDVRITDMGLDLLNQLQKEQIQLDSLNRLSGEESAQLSELLDRLRG
jgi:DNA-binding MarR family transcriptional regulator